MNNNGQSQALQGLDVQAFQSKIEALRGTHRTFASCVRKMYPYFAESIREGVPLEAILVQLNEQFHLNGSMTAFKSALYRIRREIEAAKVLGLMRQGDEDVPPDMLPSAPAPAAGFRPSPYVVGIPPAGTTQPPYQAIAPSAVPPAHGWTNSNGLPPGWAMSAFGPTPLHGFFPPGTFPAGPYPQG